MTLQYRRSPGSWRHIGVYGGNLWLLRAKMWMVVLFLLYIWKIKDFLSTMEILLIYILSLI